MTLRSIISATALLVLSASPHSAFAQDMAAPVSTPVARDVSKADIEAASRQFELRMDAMKVELDGLIAAHRDNLDALAPKIDEVVSRYQSDFDAFSALADAYFAVEIAKAETPELAQLFQHEREQLIPMLQSLPDLVRAGAMEAARNPK